MNNKIVIPAFIGMGVAILILLGIVIFRKPQSTETKFDKTPYVEKIKALEEENKLLHKDNTLKDSVISKVTKEYDVLQKSKTIIKTIYAPQKAFIPNATDLQLDSIIRANLRKRTR